MTFNHKEAQKQNISDLIDKLQATLNYNVSQDIDGLTEMLMRQTIALDTAFQRLLVDCDKKKEWKEEIYYSINESKYHSAFQAQSQCRQTVNELRSIMRETKNKQTN